MIDFIKKHIDQYDIISFDLFDTVFTRCFLQPDDVFRYIESLEKCDGFTEARIQAEKNAFTSGGSACFEVTLDEIYNCISEKYKVFKEVELDIEKKCISINPIGNELYKYAISNEKKVIFVSDSYLSSNFLRKILIKLGYNNYEKLFVSSEYNKTKRNGNIFDEIEKNFSLDSILHIGDNYHSDYLKPQENKINSIYLNERTYEYCFSNYNGRFWEFIKSVDEPSIRSKLSILAKMDLLNFRQEKNSYIWSKIGFCYSAPMILSFVKWIEKIAYKRNISHILFVARDGYFLNDTFQKTNRKINSTYLYLNRNIINNVSRDNCKMQEYIDYIKNLTDSESVMVVDVGTNNFSMQKFLLDNGINCLGAYWCTGQDLEELDYYKFFDSVILPQYDSFFGCGLIEFFMTSPEPPIVDVKIDNNRMYPIYSSNVSPYEKYRINSLEKMDGGVQLFLKYYKNYLSQLDPSFTSEDIILWNSFWLNKPSDEEKNEFGKIYHASDEKHVDYTPQFRFKKCLDESNTITTYTKYLSIFKGVFRKWI